MTEEESEIVGRMFDFGGSFVSALADAYYHGDEDNRRRIREAFPEIWEKYSKWGYEKTETKEDAP